MSPIQVCTTCGTTYAGRLCPNCVSDAAREASKGSQEEAWLPGRVFHGLEIVEEIGRGGMGIVYKARQPSLDRHVALKVLPEDKSRVPDFRIRFEREAKALASLSHPNILGIHDFGEEEGIFFFVMEYVEGGSLRPFIETQKSDPKWILELMSQICDGLAWAHEQGIIHRDIKPDNILLDQKGRVKIADFGLVKLTGSAPDSLLTQSGAAMGTLHYMAPEQLEDPAGVDHRADIYSTGVILYEMLTGKLPVGHVQAPSRFDSPLPRLDPVVLKAIANVREERYQEIDDLKRELVRVATDLSTESAVPTVVSTVSKNRKPVMTVVALFLAAGLIAGGYVLFRKKGPADPVSVPSPVKTATPELSVFLPGAAAMDRDSWERLLKSPGWPPSPSDFPNQPLTFLALVLYGRTHIHYSSGQTELLRTTIDRTKAVTLLHPDYIQEVRFEGGSGTCSFESPAFRGTVAFDAKRKEGEWVITRFRFPEGGWETRLTADGTWKTNLKGTVPHPEFQRITFSPFEGPLGRSPIPESGYFPRNPYRALKSDQTLPVLKHLHTLFWHHDASFETDEVREAYGVDWPGCTLIAVDSHKAAAMARLLGDGVWGHRKGSFLVVASIRHRTARAEFMDLVQRLQKKLGLPGKVPDLPIRSLQFSVEDLPGGWSRSSRDAGFSSLSLPVMAKELFFESERVLPGLEEKDLGSVYCDAFERSENKPEIRLTVLEFVDEETANRFERWVREDFPWPRMKRFTILRASQTLAILMSKEGAGEAFSQIKGKLRRWMGLSVTGGDQRKR